MKSQVLNQKTVKKLGLDKAEIDLNNQTEVKTWTSFNDYWNEEFDEKHKNRKWYIKVADFFKYSIYWKVRDWYYDTKWYFKNLRSFQKVIKEYRPWDHSYLKDLIKFGLENLAHSIETGNEEEISAGKKATAIRELIKEIDYDYEDSIFDKYLSKNHDVNKIVKYEDGSVMFDYKDDKDREKRREKYEKALKKARKAHYDKIFRIILGQDDAKVNEEFEKRKATLTEEEKAKYEKEGYYYLWTEIFDGTGIEGWWE